MASVLLTAPGSSPSSPTTQFDANRLFLVSAE
jgi:hypothetical protein